MNARNFFTFRPLNLICVGAIAIAIVVMGAQSSFSHNGQYQNNLACPRGSANAVDFRTFDGHTRAKACWRGSTDTLFYKDIHADGIGSYGYARFSSAGNNTTFSAWFFTPSYTGAASSNYFDRKTASGGINNHKPLRIWACSENVSTGRDYGCGGYTDAKEVGSSYR